MKYFYEIHVCGKNGFSTVVISDIEYDAEANEDEIILLGYEQDRLEGEDCHYIDYIQELTEDEYNEHFNFNEYMCQNCGGGFRRSEMVFDEDNDCDLCTSCAK